MTRSSGPSGGPSSTTRYAFGVYEVEGAITRKYYSLAGQVIAVRDSGLGLSYLYGDQLGSISASTNASGAALRTQYFDAWGKRLSGSIPATDRSFTGQELDDTGLLFYHARYYDPGIGRFVSADSIVPGAGSLTVTPHDAVAAAAWGKRGAAANPQALNRYSYVNNNPLRHIDPTGHCIFGLDTIVCVAALGALLVGGSAYIAVDTATRYAREHPTNVCTYTVCAPAQSKQTPAAPKPKSTEQSGKTAPAGSAPDPDEDNDPWEQKLFKPEYTQQQKNQVQKLMNQWDEGTYTSKAHSIVDHAQRHGYGNNYIKYLMDAAGFNTRGATRTVLDAVTNTVRYTKRSGEFITYRDGKIVTYGWNTP